MTCVPCKAERIRERHSKWLADARREWRARRDERAVAVAAAYNEATRAVARAAACAKGRPYYGGMGSMFVGGYDYVGLFGMYLLSYGNHADLGKCP